MTIVLTVQVTPNAKQTAVVGVQDGVWKIRLAAKPVDGEANAALVAFLAEVLSVPKRNIEIARGTSGRMKRVAVEGIDEGALVRLKPADKNT